MEWLDEILKALEEEGFTTYNFGTGVLEIGWVSPAGQDFGFTVEHGEDALDLSENLFDVWYDFDVSAEAYIWLDENGHGRNGAPYDMKDVYEDMEACRESILEAREIVMIYIDNY